METPVSMLLLSVMLGLKIPDARQMIADMARRKRITEAQASSEIFNVLEMANYITNSGQISNN